MSKVYEAYENAMDEFTPKHSPAAGLVLAASEAIRGLVLNGVDPKKLGRAMFAMFAHYAEPHPFFKELLENWAEDGDWYEFRLEELREYNKAKMEGTLGED